MYRYCAIITAEKGQCYLLFFLCVNFCNQWLLCGVLAVGLPDHPQCFFYVLLALPVVVLVDGLLVPGLALCVQGCVRTFVVDCHVLVVQDVIVTGAVASAVSGLRR